MDAVHEQQDVPPVELEAVNRTFAQDVQPDDEVEGIAALDLGPSGSQLHVLNVGSGWKSTFRYLQHSQSAG